MIQFVPHQPPKMITVEIAEKEFKVIEYLRKIQFGKAIIYKADGLLVRIEIIESEKI